MTANKSINVFDIEQTNKKTQPRFTAHSARASGSRPSASWPHATDSRSIGFMMQYRLTGQAQEKRCAILNINTLEKPHG